MSIEIKISGDTPLEALSLVAAFGLRCQCDKDVYTVASRMLEAELTKEAARNPQPVADLPPEPSVEEPPHGSPSPAPPEEPAPAPQPEPAAPAKPRPPKLEDVRAEGLKAARAHGQKAVRAILDQFGADSMTALAEEDRAPFLEALRQLGEADA
ncbi:MAG: hypothetical protein ACI3U8_07340 [Candidatus Onthomonas sp.]